MIILLAPCPIGSGAYGAIKDDRNAPYIGAPTPPRSPPCPGALGPARPSPLGQAQAALSDRTHGFHEPFAFPALSCLTGTFARNHTPGADTNRTKAMTAPKPPLKVMLCSPRG